MTLAKAKTLAPGIALCALAAIPCWYLGTMFPIVGGPVFGILLGMAIALFWKDKKSLDDGIAFTSKKILQYAVILLGFGLNLFQIAQVGAMSLPVICSTIATSLIVAFLFYKIAKAPANTSTLIGVGSSICGGSAIAATAPVIKAKDEEIAQAIAVVFLFNVIAALKGALRVVRALDNCTVYTLWMDPVLNRSAYIMPGLGDAGDRLNGCDTEDSPRNIIQLIADYGSNITSLYRSQLRKIEQTVLGTI